MSYSVIPGMRDFQTNGIQYKKHWRHGIRFGCSLKLQIETRRVIPAWRSNEEVGQFCNILSITTNRLQHIFIAPTKTYHYVVVVLELSKGLGIGSFGVEICTWG